MSDRDNDAPNDAGEGRLSRWSRLKTQARAGQDVSEIEEAPADGEPGSQVPAPTGDESEEKNFVLEDLPDIETLDKDSDFTPFLNVNVPDQLRRLALKKLWASDPVFASLDGLNDYDDDYSTLGMIVEKVSSVFQPGKGMPEPEPEPEQLQSGAEDPQQPAEEVAEASTGEDDAESPDDADEDAVEAEAESAASAQDADAPDDPEESEESTA